MCGKVKRQSSCFELMCQCSCIQCSLDVLSNCLCIYYFEFDCLSFPDYRPVNATLIINTADSSVILNETFTITCDAQANPPATYEIFRDDGNKVGSNSVVTTSVTEVEENNSVTFTCKASNGYGDGPTAKITLEVYCKCIVSVTVSSRYVRGVKRVALLIYKYDCTLYWYYKTSVLY